ncbi:hypothetical protein YTPLAS18_19760 [Nitrospira sp.]|nr:hypothetical protein YTPLAS18_19760 [Nitrospira sp.]
MDSVDTLMLDAKQAILDDAHNRFVTLQKEGRTREAMQQFQVTLGCATDLLNESILVLERVLAAQQDAQPPQPGPSPTDPMA